MDRGALHQNIGPGRRLGDVQLPQIAQHGKRGQIKPVDPDLIVHDADGCGAGRQDEPIRPRAAVKLGPAAAAARHDQIVAAVAVDRGRAAARRQQIVAGAAGHHPRRPPEREAGIAKRQVELGDPGLGRAGGEQLDPPPGRHHRQGADMVKACRIAVGQGHQADQPPVGQKRHDLDPAIGAADRDKATLADLQRRQRCGTGKAVLQPVDHMVGVVKDAVLQDLEHRQRRAFLRGDDGEGRPLQRQGRDLGRFGKAGAVSGADLTGQRQRAVRGDRVGRDEVVGGRDRQKVGAGPGLCDSKIVDIAAARHRRRARHRRQRARVRQAPGQRRRGPVGGHENVTHPARGQPRHRHRVKGQGAVQRGPETAARSQRIAGPARGRHAAGDQVRPARGQARQDDDIRRRQMMHRRPVSLHRDQRRGARGARQIKGRIARAKPRQVGRIKPRLAIDPDHLKIGDVRAKGRQAAADHPDGAITDHNGPPTIPTGQTVQARV